MMVFVFCFVFRIPNFSLHSPPPPGQKCRVVAMFTIPNVMTSVVG